MHYLELGMHHCIPTFPNSTPKSKTLTPLTHTVTATMAEDGQDPFAWLIKFCKPTESQEAKLTNCPFARDSENFTDSNPPSQFSSMTQSDAGDIVVVTAPGSSSSGGKSMLEEESVFHTPPEHHSRSQLSSSEDQNPNEAGSDDRRRKLRVSEAGLDDEPESKRVRVVAVEECDSETVPLGKTEVVGIEEDEGVHNTTEVIVAISDDSDGEEKGELGENNEIEKAVECATMRKDSRHGVGDGGGCEGRGRRLPPSLNGEGNNEVVVESSVGLLEMMNKLRAIFGYTDDSISEDIDFIETAKKKGMTFPKPRWQHDS